jgi:replicative DNA helicase
MRKRSEVAASRRGEDSSPPRPAVEFTIPHDLVNELVVIAAAIVADEPTRNKLLARIQPEHFFTDENRATWAGLVEMKNRKLAFDYATLQTIAGDTVQIGKLRELAEMRPEVPVNLEHHVDALQWDRRRTVAAKGPISSLLEALRNPNEAPERVRALAKHVAQAFDGHTDRQYIYDPEQLVAEAMSNIRKRLEGHAIFPYGISGLDYFEAELDGTRARRMIPGTVPGQITLLTGISGSGKSSFSIHLILGQARQGKHVLVGAWEVLAPMTIEMLAVVDLGWSRADLLDPLGALKRGNPLTPELLVKLETRMHALSKFVRFVKNPFRRTRGEKKSNDANLDLVQSIVADSGCSVFVADLWARCLASRKPDEEEEALFRYQAMLEEMSVHSIMVHQQRLKDIEMRPDKRPTREGAKGSGAYIEVADTILGTHRPAQWKRLDDDKLEVFVLKQRFGKWPLGVEFDWNGEMGSISGGSSIPYEHTSESHMGDFSGFTQPGEKKRRGGSSR